ncbi:alpha/beta hydrolase-fold protein [Pelagicoccus sp. SDUM812002]|uniref:alpha/beta hydrolase n=1 Tax=Pelagicoccus sp. SDUM812002 TaxID=3041266 RepID=UPI0028101F68|nr:alpha/beta hydrolase-fold protein [Pelagicoccus sp. SDUM812002]MDQ8185153.1 alpha/beta hydrolase-fold protein [Pelagicoccus sp. SDUM812002]
MKTYPILATLALFATTLAQAQQANVNLDWNPQKNTENLTPFSAPLNSPEVHDDRTVTFRVKAPDAEKVELNGAILAAFGRSWGDTMPFEKGDDGIWELIIGPVRPDIYAYLVQVDGVQVPDPSNTIASFTGMPPYSQLVVHGDEPAYYDAKNVPHGTIARHIYHSDVTDGERDLYVYTPPGYDSSKKYPVLYLMGGSGELPHNWIYDGRANFILDNLYAEGKAKPMIMVIPNNQVIHRNHPEHRQLSFGILERELRQHVVPLVDSNYSTIQSPSGRALSGLSMGGRHTMIVGLNSLDLFGSFGILSAGATDAEEVLADFLNDPKANQKVDYLFIGQGKQEAEGRWNDRVQALVDTLKAHDIEYEYSVAGYTAHDWATWRALLHEDFLPNLWRDQ